MLDKFKATNVQNGVVVSFERLSANRFKGTWAYGYQDSYHFHSQFYTQKQVQDALLAGTIVISNPATHEVDYEERPLPAKFFYTTLDGRRYTAYVQDDVVAISWGEGMDTQAHSLSLKVVKERIASGYYKVLEESYRTPSLVATEFMQFMQSQSKMTDEDALAIAQTILLLNKVMYEYTNKPVE